MFSVILEAEAKPKRMNQLAVCFGEVVRSSATAQSYTSHAIRCLVTVMEGRLMPQEHVRALSLNGEFFKAGAQIPHAFNDIQKALELREEHVKNTKSMAWLEGVNEDEVYSDLAYSLRNLAAYYLEVGRIDEAVEKCNEAMEIFEKQNVAVLQIPVRDLGDFSRTLQEELAACGSNPDCQASVYLSFGTTATKAADWARAEKNLELAVKLLQESRDSKISMLIGAFSSLAQVYFMNSRFTSSADAFVRAMKLEVQEEGIRPKIVEHIYSGDSVFVCRAGTESCLT